MPLNDMSPTCLNGHVVMWIRLECDSRRWEMWCGVTWEHVPRVKWHDGVVYSICFARVFPKQAGLISQNKPSRDVN